MNPFRFPFIVLGCFISPILSSSDTLSVPNTDSVEGDIPKEVWPEQWFIGPQKASDVGLTTFKQSPILDPLVKNGELPSLRERLPEDPIVVVPIDQIGKHGGTASLFQAGEQLLNVSEGPLRPDPQMRLNLPNFAERVAYSNNSRTLTVYLRKGHKWSDGHPATSDDFIFWFTHVLMDKRLTPVVEPRFKDAKIEKHDDLSFSYHFPEPKPLFVNYLAHSGWRLSIPAHFMQKYHPSFTPIKQLEDEAKELGLQDWRTYFQAVNNTNDLMVFNRPEKTAYIVVSRTSTRTRLKRNPYYPKVDPDGNQLPYIDFIEVQRVDSAEIMTAKASTGQVDFAGRQFKTSDIPLFKKFEVTNGYQTYLWPRPYGSDVALMVNLTHPDTTIRNIFQDVRFRRALSLSINREEINDIAYYGHGVPRQLTVVPSSRFFEPRFAKAFSEFAPNTASELLNQMGLLDVDSDGIREKPDGSPLDITLEYSIGETPKQITVDLVTAHWREVGLRVNSRQISGALKSIRSRAGVMDMSLWHADRNADILFPIEPFWYVPMHIGQEVTHWSEWSRFYRSDGSRGLEPPPEVKDLIKWWEVLRKTEDVKKRVDYGKRILQSQSENLWAIGIIGLGPHPVIVSNRLKNVPRNGYWGWDSRWSWPYYPETWYLKEIN